MSRSVLTIRDQEYALPEVQLTGDHAVMEGQHLLSFNLDAVANPEEEAKRTGFAINCIVVRGFSQLRELQGQTIALGAGEADPMNNELNESVIVERGDTLELRHLVLRFGGVAGDHIGVQLEVTCFELSGDEEERDIEVRGRLWARIGHCQERLTL